MTLFAQVMTSEANGANMADISAIDPKELIRTNFTAPQRVTGRAMDTYNGV